MAKFERFLPGKYLLRRMTAMLTGVCFMGISVALLSASNLGTDPFTSVCLAIAKQTGWLLGSTELAVNGILLCIVLTTGSRQLGVGTLANMVLVGYVADFIRWLLTYFSIEAPATGAGRFLLMLAALAVFIVAASFYMTADLGTAPYDAMAFILAGKMKRASFRAVRIAWDAIWIVLTLLLGGTVGPVTIGIMLAMGPIVTLIGRWNAVWIYG